ncbi:MAG: PepSY-like domain-containing protein, partial [Bacteroidota bacterium]
CAGMTFAQEAIKENEVPPEIREDFQYRFHEAKDILWLQQGDSYYGARFKLDGDLSEAVYTADGQWIQTEEPITYRQMPDRARDYCRSNYPEYSAKDVRKVSTRKYGILYEIRIRKSQKQIGMTFDMNGKLLDENESEVEVQEEKGLKGKLGKLFKKKK